MRKIVIFLLTIFLLFQVINVCFVKGETDVASNFQFDERHSGFYPYSIQTTGVPRYKFYVDASIASPLITSNDLIVVASKKNIYITDKQVSKIKVFEKSGEFLSSIPPFQIDDSLIFLTDPTTLKCISLNDFTERWKFGTNSYINMPLIYKGRIYFTTQDGYLYSIDTFGRFIWKVKTEISSTYPPAIFNDILYGMGSFGRLEAYYLSGKLKWSIPLANDFLSTSNGSIVIGPNGIIYVSMNSKDKGTLFAIDSNGKIINTFSLGQVVISPSIDENGNIYIGDTDGNLYILGNYLDKIRSFNLGGAIKHEIVLSKDGTALVNILEKKLIAVDSEGHIKWSFSCDKSIFTSPVIDSDSIVYLVANDGFLYAFKDFTLKVETVGSGTVKVTPNKPFYAPNETVTLTASPTMPFRFTSWEGDVPFDHIKDNPLSISITKDLLIKAHFAIVLPNLNYTITTDSNGYGTISPASKEVIAGDCVSFLITPNEFYTVKDVLVDGVSVMQDVLKTDDGKFVYTFYNVSSNHKMYVDFEKLNFSIFTKVGEGGKILPSGVITLEPHESFYFYIVPDTGYKVKSVIVDGQSYGEEYIHGFVNVVSNHTIEAVFEKLKYEIKVEVLGNGHVEPGGPVLVEFNDNKSFNFIPDEGFDVSEVFIDGISVGKIYSYTFTKVNNTHNMKVIFAKKTKEYKIVLKVGSPSFTVNEELKTLDSPPIIKNNRTLAPIRPIIESIGGNISWDGSERRVDIEIPNVKRISLWIGNNKAKVFDIANNKEFEIQIDSTNPSVVPEIINGRTMLPLRFISENLGENVNWDPNTKTIIIVFIF